MSLISRWLDETVEFWHRRRDRNLRWELNRQNDVRELRYAVHEDSRATLQDESKDGLPQNALAFIDADAELKVIR